MHVESFGPITEPDQLGPTLLDKAIAIVDNGKPAVVDVSTQPREFVGQIAYCN